MRAFACGLALILLPACGGRAALEAYYLEGEGGGGASSTSVSSSTSSTSTSSTSTSSTSTSSTSTSTSTSSASTSSASSSGSGFCDNTGNCQLCIDCAFEGPCQAIWNACFANPQCTQFAECMSDCSAGPCFQQCSSQYPGGAEPYIDAVQCLFCDECIWDCEDQAPPQLCNL